VLDEIAAELAGVAKIARINVAYEPALAGRFQVSAVPAFHLYNGGHPVHQVAGAMPKAQLMELIRSVTG
jgi:thioredoxin 1